MIKIARSPSRLIVALVRVLLVTAPIVAVDASAALATSPAEAAARQVRTPPMGFSTWNTFGCRVTAADVRAMADAIVELGLRDAGYRYVNVDDCWGATHRNARGQLVANHARFPSGMKAIGKYLHDRGLRFGIYSSAGTHTCNKRGFPGALGHELSDARQFARWGVDYLKYDNCHTHGQPYQKRFGAMRRALDQLRRPIVYSICTAGQGEPWTWGHKLGNLWRTGRDIRPTWASVVSSLHANQGLAAYARPGHWNDPDQLVVGRHGLTIREQRTQMSLWSMMASPLLISTELREIGKASLRILRNSAVIAIDQDRLGKQARVIRSHKGLTTYVKVLANGDRAVALLNETGRAAMIHTTATAVGLPRAGRYVLRGLWSNKRHGTDGDIRAWVPPHATVLYRVWVKRGTQGQGATAWAGATAPSGHPSGSLAARAGGLATIS